MQPRRSQRPRSEKHPFHDILQRVSDIGPWNQRQRLRRRDTTLGENMNRHGGHGSGGHADAIVEHPLVDVVGEHEGSVYIAGGAARHAYVSRPLRIGAEVGKGSAGGVSVVRSYETPRRASTERTLKHRI